MVEGEEEWRLLLETAGDRLVVVDFHAVWCGPCRVVAPVFERLSREYASAAVFLKVDVDRNSGISSACGVTAMPTFQFYKNVALVQELRGANAAELERLVSLHAGEAGPSTAPGVVTKRFKSFPPDLYAIFEGERNIDSVWTKILQFNGQLLGKEGHMTGITTLAQLKSLFTLTQNARYFGTVVPEAGLALLDRLLASWPASSAFPLLDILRRVVLIESAAEHYARMAAGSGGSMERVLGLLADGSGSGLGGVLMGVRFLANCFYHRSTRKLLAGHVTALGLVKQFKAHDNKQVRLAVATFLLNYVKASACDKEGSGEEPQHTLATIASCLAVESEDDAKLRFALALGSLVSAQPSLKAAAKSELAFFGLPAAPTAATPLGLALSELAQLLTED